MKLGFRRGRSRSRKSTSDLMKIENQSRKLSHKPDGVGRNRTVLLSSNFANESNAFDPVKTRFSESQAEAEEPTNPSTSSQAL